MGIAKLGYRLSFLLFLLGLSSCSSVKEIDLLDQRRAELESYLHQHVQEKGMYVKLRETARAKVLEISPELMKLQSQVAPGFELTSKEGIQQWVVSFEMPDWSRFNVDDFKFYLNDIKSSSVKEIMDVHLIQTLYPYAARFERVFLLQFKTPLTESAKTLRAQTPQGQFEFRSPEGN